MDPTTSFVTKLVSCPTAKDSPQLLQFEGPPQIKVRIFIAGAQKLSILRVLTVSIAIFLEKPPLRLGRVNGPSNLEFSVGADMRNLGTKNSAMLEHMHVQEEEDIDDDEFFELPPEGPPIEPHYLENIERDIGSSWIGPATVIETTRKRKMMTPNLGVSSAESTFNAGTFASPQANKRTSSITMPSFNNSIAL